MFTLTLYVTDQGMSLANIPELEGRASVSFTDIRHRDLYGVNPDEFFSTYAKDYVINNIHLVDDVLKNALDYAQKRDASLTLVGHLFEKDFSENTPGVRVIHVRAPKALTLTGTRTTLVLSANDSIRAALTKEGRPTSNLTHHAYWNAWFQRFYHEEAVPRLLPKKEASFFNFLKWMARANATRVNLNRASRDLDVSRTCLYRWIDFLVEHQIVDAVPAEIVQAPRRNTHRTVYFFRNVSLLLWLTMGEARDKRFTKKLFLTLFYLKKSSQHRDHVFSHYFDTNHLEIPLIEHDVVNGRKTGYAFTVGDEEAKTAEHTAHWMIYPKVAQSGYLTDAIIIRIPAIDWSKETASTLTMTYTRESFNEAKEAPGNPTPAQDHA